MTHSRRLRRLNAQQILLGERVWETSQQAASYGSGVPLPLLANWKSGHVSIACKTVNSGFIGVPIMTRAVQGGLHPAPLAVALPQTPFGTPPHCGDGYAALPLIYFVNTVTIRYGMGTKIPTEEKYFNEQGAAI